MNDPAQDSDPQLQPRKSNSNRDSSSVASAFPCLPEDLTQLPEIPGGWQIRRFELATRWIELLCPADPDLFLDDEQVLKENSKNDYMPFWAFLWPTSITMSQLLARSPWRIGSNVLELGSGLGLVGLAAVDRGDCVTFSDHDRTALHVCRMNAVRNGLQDANTLLLDWREPIDRTFDVIIGSEVTYDAPMHEVILKLLKRMLADDGTCWFADPGRYQSQFFLKLASDLGFDVRLFNRSLEQIEKPLSGEFQLIELCKA